MLEKVFSWISDHVIILGYPAVIFLMFLEGIIIFIPSELVLPFIGFLVYETRFSLVWAILAATLGSLLGAVLTYEVSRVGGRSIVRKYGSYVFLDERHLVSAEMFYKRYGERTIFFSRLIPVVRQLISIPAGTTRTSRTKFIIYTFAGSLLWNTILIYAGFLLGREWHRVNEYTQPIDILAIALIVTYVSWKTFRYFEEHTFLRGMRPRIVKKSKELMAEQGRLGKKLHKGLKKRLRKKRF
jgi:membrane protein DedA with SNARE-associated domain